MPARLTGARPAEPAPRGACRVNPTTFVLPEAPRPRFAKPHVSRHNPPPPAGESAAGVADGSDARGDPGPRRFDRLLCDVRAVERCDEPSPKAEFDCDNSAGVCKSAEHRTPSRL